MSEGPNEDMNKEKFVGNLRRLAHREELGKHLADPANNKNIQRIIETSKENFPALDRQIEELVASEFSIEPTRYAFIRDFSDELKDAFPNIQDLAILPLGSVIRGGANVRKIMGRDGEGSDLDWGIAYTGSLSSADTTKINHFATKRIQALAQQKGLPETKSSSYINPANFNVPNLQSAQEAVDFIRAMNEHEADWDPWTNPLVLYLGPSIPPEFNIQNRRFLLDGLSKLSLEDHRLWEETVDQLNDSWNQHLRIKPKHLQGKHTTGRVDMALRKKVVDSSREARGKQMEKLLYSTDKSVDLNQKAS